VQSASWLAHRFDVRAELLGDLLALIFRRGLDLVLGHADRHAVFADLKLAPVDRDLVGADAEESAELDDGGACLPVGSDQQVRDLANLLAIGALGLLADEILTSVVACCCWVPAAAVRICWSEEERSRSWVKTCCGSAFPLCKAWRAWSILGRSCSTWTCADCGGFCSA
jgi:hypothetical protein